MHFSEFKDTNFNLYTEFSKQLSKYQQIEQTLKHELDCQKCTYQQIQLQNDQLTKES